jgi:hypothetical protein
VAQQLNWVLKSPLTSPTPHYGHAMAYDTARGQVVLFGGADGPFLANDTWVWDGTNWTQKSPTSAPSWRYMHGMAYDAARGQVVLFGGYDGSNRNDTWVWDGTNWTQKYPLNSPTPRNTHALAYDAAHGQVVLFGGNDSTGVRNDTWVWDGTNWTQKYPLNSPAGRAAHAMAYDSAHGQVVLFGGAGTNQVLVNDTWVWDGTNWNQRYALNSPALRAHSAMAYDASRGQVVLFGGNNISGDVYNDTWVWDGTNWTERNPLNSPTTRVLHRMAYDAARGQVVLFGGKFADGAGALLNDTWVWGSASPTPGACPILPLTSIEALAQDPGLADPVHDPGGTLTTVLENTNGIDEQDLQPSVNVALQRFRNSVNAQPGGHFNLQSAFRTKAYQQHLREVYDNKHKLDALIADHPECQVIQNEVNQEFTRHQLGTQRPGDPQDPNYQRHTTGAAIDVGLNQSGLSLQQMITLGCTANLYRPLLPGDQAHFELRPSTTTRCQ